MIVYVLSAVHHGATESILGIFSTADKARRYGVSEYDITWPSPDHSVWGWSTDGEIEPAPATPPVAVRVPTAEQIEAYRLQARAAGYPV